MERELKAKLKSWLRIRPQQACSETLFNPPELTVWLFLNGMYVSLSRKRISSLWAADDNQRSLCNLLFRDVLNVTASQYADLKKQFNAEGFPGIYKSPNGTYAIVIKLRKDMMYKITGLAALAASVIGGGSAFLYMTNKSSKTKADASKTESAEGLRPRATTPRVPDLPDQPVSNAQHQTRDDIQTKSAEVSRAELASLVESAKKLTARSLHGISNEDYRELRSNLDHINETINNKYDVDSDVDLHVQFKNIQQNFDDNLKVYRLRTAIERAATVINTREDKNGKLYHAWTWIEKLKSSNAELLKLKQTFLDLWAQYEAIEDLPTGLVIGGKVFEKLSGPVTYSILKPANEWSPVFILFGESHVDLWGLCAADVPKIWDASFIDSLNVLSTNKQNVHFYMEHMLNLTLQKYNVPPRALGYSGVVGEMDKTVSCCFLPKFQERYDACPAKNIQWHFGDPRTLGYQYENFLPERWWEAVFFGLLHSLNDVGQWMANMKRLLPETGFDVDMVVSEVRRVLRAIMDLNAGEIAHSLVNNPNFTQVSLISRQLENAPFARQWRDEWFVLYFEILLAEQRGIKEAYAKVNKELLMRLIDELGQAPTHFSDFSHLFSMLVALTTPVFDLYVLTRVTKRLPTPKVVCVLVGTHHVETMTTFLTHVRWNTSMGRDLKNKTRCVKFEERFDIDWLVSRKHD